MNYKRLFSLCLLFSFSFNLFGMEWFGQRVDDAVKRAADSIEQKMPKIVENMINQIRKEIGIEAQKEGETILDALNTRIIAQVGKEIRDEINQQIGLDPERQEALIDAINNQVVPRVMQNVVERTPEFLQDILNHERVNPILDPIIDNVADRLINRLNERLPEVAQTLNEQIPAAVDKVAEQVRAHPDIVDPIIEHTRNGVRGDVHNLRKSAFNFIFGASAFGLIGSFVFPACMSFLGKLAQKKKLGPLNNKILPPEERTYYHVVRDNLIGVVSGIGVYALYKLVQHNTAAVA